MAKKYRIYNNDKLNDKIIAKVSTAEKEFILKNLEKLNNTSRELDLSLSAFTRLATLTMAESLALGKFDVKISIPERALTFKLTKK